jgi:predicted small integral membrane protein
MTIRLSKCALLAAVAFYYALIVFNNLTDYESNHLFVEHVLSMDSIFQGSHEIWRAIPSARVQTLFYISIITWEFVTAVLCWWGTARLFSKRRAAAPEWNAAKPMAIGALTLGCLMWFVAFLSVGGEWFLMWQSKTWDGRESAFRMFAMMGIVLIYLAMPEVGPGLGAAAERK